LGKLKQSCRPAFEFVEDRQIGNVLETILSCYEQQSEKPIEYHIVNATNELEVKHLVGYILKNESKTPFISPSLFPTKQPLLKNLHLTLMKGNLCDLSVQFSK